MRTRGWRLILPLALGTTLNPLNSSMMAVALVTFSRDFGVDLGTSTWLVSSFYLAGAVGQPLMGRLADLLGARRVFIAGLAVAGGVSALAPLAPAYGWLVLARAVQALATSTAFPAALGMIRAGGRSQVPAGRLAMLAVAGSTSAALGPTIGGLLLSAWGWQAIFLVNLPMTVAGIVLGLRLLPAPPPSDPAGHGWASADFPGVLLFAATITPLLGALLEHGSGASWLLLAATPLAGALLAVRELRTESPFFDLRLLARNPAMVGVYVQFAAVTFVFYSFFFGLPVWLEQVRNLDPRTAGLLVLPVTGLGVVVTPAAARMVARIGPRPVILLGSCFLLAGTLLMLALGPLTPVVMLVAVAVALGVPNGFNNIGLQAALYEATPPERLSWAAGQFQTFRYVGAIIASAVLGSVFAAGATTSGLHAIAGVLAAVSAGLVVASLLLRRPPAAPLSPS